MQKKSPTRTAHKEDKTHQLGDGKKDGEEDKTNQESCQIADNATDLLNVRK